MFPLVWVDACLDNVTEIRYRGTRIGSPQMSGIRFDMVSMRFIRVKSMNGVLEVLNREFNVY